MTDIPSLPAKKIAALKPPGTMDRSRLSSIAAGDEECNFAKKIERSAQADVEPELIRID